MTHDDLRAKAQSDLRRSLVAKLEDMTIEVVVARLDAQDEGKTVRGRRASVCGANSRFSPAVSEAHLKRFIKADLQAERFRWSVDEDAISNTELFDAKTALLTNVKDLSPVETTNRY